MTFKKFIGFTHLWLGLIAGFIMVINLIPAAIFVFNEELSAVFYHDAIYVEDIKAHKLSVSILQEKAQAALPKTDTITSVEVNNEPDKNYSFGVFRANKHPGIFFFSEYDVYKQVYVDPYTGKVRGVIDLKYNWIYLCRVIHQQMLLRYDIGHWFIAVVSLILIISLLTGIILWWPKNKAAFKQRFTIKWDARWRRKNYDFHNVGGFYSHLIILLLVVTGLIWSFAWWANGFYKVLGDDYKTMGENYQKVSATKIDTSKLISYDKVFADAQTKHSGWTEMYIYRSPISAKDRLITAYLTFNTHSGWEESDIYVYNADNGMLIKQLLQNQKTTAVKWQNSNYGIHTGSIYGLPTKILMFVVTLFCASLPITGFLIWWGRRKKQKKGKSKTKHKQKMRS